MGKRVKVTSFGETLSGIAVDVDSDGALILKMRDGSQKRVVAGDVVYK
jgi:BirA family biotin operon repressor/biotin-[acetyl-CoA-carboxylase] ligase